MTSLHNSILVVTHAQTKVNFVIATMNPMLINTTTVHMALHSPFGIV